MRGWVAAGVTDPHRGADLGRSHGSTLRFDATISTPDIDAVIKDPATTCRIEGKVRSSLLSPDPLVIEDGRFRLMVPDLTRTETMHMRYEMDLRADDGSTFRLDGFKVIRTEPPWRAWPATTTLHVTVRDDDGVVVCAGIVTIGLRDFLALLRSMEVTGTSRIGSLVARARFARMFAGRLVRRYAASLDLVGRFREGDGHELRQLTLPAGEPRWRDRDGTWHNGLPPAHADDAYLKLTRHRGGAKGPVLLAPGFGMNAASFAMPTVDRTLAEHLCDAGYDVWLFDHRASIDLPSCRTEFDIDAIALDDWPAAVDEVRSVTGASSVQLLGHCVGSVTILMAILGGMDGVRSAVCSQFTVHPTPGWLNRIKNALHVGELLELLRLRGIDDTAKPTPVNRALDLVMAIVPVPRGERCGRPVCRWLNATYGLTHTHHQLNEATHEMLDEAFGYGNLHGIQHLARMHRRRRTVDASGADRYLPAVDRLSMPILFVQGRHNRILRPAGTKRTVRWLERHHGQGHHRYLELPDYAHLDTMIGARAADDVFPHIVEHLDATN